MKIQSTFKTWKTSRESILNFLNDFSLDQLNLIPAGFNNNLIWNAGHLIVAQQALTYKACGLDGHIPNQLYPLYKPGSKPTGTTDQEEVEELKTLLISTIQPTIDDFEAGKFQNFEARMTGTGFYLSTIEDAFEFINFHEGLHIGYMMSLRKFM